MTEVEWMREFGSNLKCLLKDAMMTQKELAEDSGISESMISDYVNGLRIPGAKAIVNIANTLSCNTDDLIDFGEMIE